MCVVESPVRCKAHAGFGRADRGNGPPERADTAPRSDSHEWLARRLDRAGIAYTRQGNALTSCADLRAAQRL